MKKVKKRGPRIKGICGAATVPTVVIGLPTIVRLLFGRDVDLGGVILIPDSALQNQGEAVRWIARLEVCPCEQRRRKKRLANPRNKKDEITAVEEVSV